MIPAPFSHPAFQGKFGVARKDVSPPAGIYSRNWGAATTDVATSLHRPITLTALVIQDEGNSDPLVLLSLDLGWFRSKEEEIVLKQAILDAGIQPDRFLLALSHTHAGPVFCPGESGKPGGLWIPAYLQTLSDNIRAAITEALTNTKRGILEVVTGTSTLASNRDFPDPATGRLLVGWNPAIVADDTILIGRVSDDDGKTLATIVNYACHPTILAWLNSAISPDFVGAMREVVEGDTAAPCLFLQGASGELAARHQYVGDLTVADRAGRSLGHAVLAAIHGMLPPGHELAYQGSVESGAPLAMWAPQVRSKISNNYSVETVTLDLPFKPDLPTVEHITRQIEECQDRVLSERLSRKLLHRKSLGGTTSETATHNLWKVGQLLFVSLANEAYSALQVDLRQAAGDTPLFVVTLANGSRGYLSPRHSYQADSYASGQSPYAAGCFERTLETLKSHIQAIA